MRVRVNHNVNAARMVKAEAGGGTPVMHLNLDHVYRSALLDTVIKRRTEKRIHVVNFLVCSDNFIHNIQFTFTECT